MSRNIRKKMPSASSKKAPRRRRASNTSSSSFDLSSNTDGYSGVEDISDSEDNDEEDVTAVEGKYIEIDEANPRPSDSPRPPVLVEEEADDEDEDDDDEEDDDDDADVDLDDNISWQGVPSEVEESQVSDFYNEATAFSSDNVERHVRFDIPDDSDDSDSTDTDEDQPYASMFPDIFVSQNSLDPAFRREIEHDPDDSSGSGSFWDYQGQYVYNEDEFETDTEEVPRQLMDDDTPVATPAPAAPEPAFEEPQDLDGYESEPCLDAGPVLFNMLTALAQPTVTLPRRTFLSLPLVERLVARPSLPARTLTRIAMCPSSRNADSPVSVVSAWTALIRSPLPS
jgi:hypothetical protein